jgi:hypothetical protein
VTVLVPSTADATGGRGGATGGSGFGSPGGTAARAGAGLTSGVAECEFAGAGRMGADGILRSGGV